MSSDEKGDDQVKAVSFAAGMAACMACIQRAIATVSVFVHWRVWAFLALNLLLLAILFISKIQKIPIDRECCGGDDADIEEEKRPESGQRDSTDGGENVKLLRKGDVEPVMDDMKSEEEGVKKDDYNELSKEELNQRVEAFIAMFREHLVSDAKDYIII